MLEEEEKGRGEHRGDSRKRRGERQMQDTERETVIQWEREREVSETDSTKRMPIVYGVFLLIKWI